MNTARFTFIQSTQSIKTPKIAISYEMPLMAKAKMHSSSLVILDLNTLKHQNNLDCYFQLLLLQENQHSILLDLPLLYEMSRKNKFFISYLFLL
jgi:hypothetical protein